MTTMTITDTTTVEVVLFGLRPGVDEEGFLRASAAIMPSIREFGGFIRRRLLKSEDGRWLDLVEWRSLAEAQRAAEAVLSSPTCQPFFQMIDETSITMLHGSTVRHYPATEPAAESEAIEFVLTKAKDGVAEADWLSAADAVMADLSTMSGYIDRRLIQAQDGWWIDTVNWRSLAEAQRAAELFPTLPSAKPLVELLDLESIVMLHLAPVQVFE